MGESCEGRSRRLSEILKGFKVKSIRAYEGTLSKGADFISRRRNVFISQLDVALYVLILNLTSRKIIRYVTYKRDSDIKRKFVFVRFVMEQIQFKKESSLFYDMTFCEYFCLPVGKLVVLRLITAE